MASHISEEELARSTGVDQYFEMASDPSNLDRTVGEIARDAARLALGKLSAADSYNMNPVSVTRTIISEVVKQTLTLELPGANRHEAG